MVGVVTFSCHKMSAPHVDPSECREPFAELLFEGVENTFEIMACRLTQGMKMESVEFRGECVGKFVGGHSETRAGQCRVVEVGFDNTAARIDTEPC